eukprot:5138507-Alexandrium_andersonii.AAC.1
MWTHGDGASPPKSVADPASHLLLCCEFGDPWFLSRRGHPRRVRSKIRVYDAELWAQEGVLQETRGWAKGGAHQDISGRAGLGSARRLLLEGSRPRRLRPAP